MFTEEEQRALFESAKNEAAAQLKNTLVENIKNASKWELEGMVKKTVLEWYKKEMEPLVIVNLDANKEMIAQTSVEVAKAVGKATAQAIAEQFADSLSTEWKRRDFLRAALGLK